METRTIEVIDLTDSSDEKKQADIAKIHEARKKIIAHMENFAAKVAASKEPVELSSDCVEYKLWLTSSYVSVVKINSMLSMLGIRVPFVEKEFLDTLGKSLNSFLKQNINLKAVIKTKLGKVVFTVPQKEYMQEIVFNTLTHPFKRQAQPLPPRSLESMKGFICSRQPQAKKTKLSSATRVIIEIEDDCNSETISSPFPSRASTFFHTSKSPTPDLMSDDELDSLDEQALILDKKSPKPKKKLDDMFGLFSIQKPYQPNNTNEILSDIPPPEIIIPNVSY